LEEIIEIILNKYKNSNNQAFCAESVAQETIQANKILNSSSQHQEFELNKGVKVLSQEE